MPEFGIVVVPLLPMEGEQGGQVAITVAAAEGAPQIQALAREEAGVEAAFGGEAGPVAAPAEGGRDGGDEADLALAVAVAPGPGNGVFPGLQRLDGPAGFQDPPHLGGGNHGLHLPAVGGAHVHELDEAQGVAALAGEGGEVEDLVVVDAALEDAVEFDGTETGGPG